MLLYIPFIKLLPISFIKLLLVLSDEPAQELPITGPWRHGSIKHMMQNVEEGKQITGEYTERWGSWIGQ